MNIDEIKRNINKGLTTNVNVSVDPIAEPERQRGKKEKIIINHEFESSEEEDPPNSKVWETGKETLAINQPVEEVINELELDDKVYDWRVKSKKGRKSRKNFTLFLKGVL